MMRFGAAGLILLSPLVLACGPEKVSVPDGALVIANVSVVDVAAGEVRTNRAVVIEGNRIRTITGTDSLSRAGAATVVDGEGLYLVPGLWDMHAHALKAGYADAYMELMIAHGVTGFREMWGDLGIATRIRRDVAAGRLVAPRFVVAGNLIDGDPPMHAGSYIATTPEEARRLVRELAAAGAEFIKPYNSLTRETYLALAEEARAVGLPIWGHVPNAVSPEEAARAGQTSMEHLGGFRCSRYEDELRKTMASEEFRNNPRSPEWRPHFARWEEQWDPEVCREAIDELVASGMWQVPTLVTLYGYSAKAADPGALDDPRLDWLLPSTVLGFADRLISESRDPDGSQRRGLEGRWRQHMQMVAQLRRQNATILAGSDVGNPWVIPGAGLHDELAFLVEAGLSPREALAAATTEAARFLGRTADLGVVAEGALADLVLLRANPLDDIEAIREIEAVVVDGHLFDREDLDARLEAAAARSDWRRARELTELAAVSGIDAALARAGQVDGDIYDLVALAVSRVTRRDHAGALAALDWAEQRLPESWWLYNVRGLVYENRGEPGDSERAITALRRSLELEPVNHYAAQRIRNLERTPTR
jgi:imidazolonepropionase-like amidohydrolase